LFLPRSRNLHFVLAANRSGIFSILPYPAPTPQKAVKGIKSAGGREKLPFHLIRFIIDLRVGQGHLFDLGDTDRGGGRGERGQSRRNIYENCHVGVRMRDPVGRTIRAVQEYR
jgi:hypothetical protein